MKPTVSCLALLLLLLGSAVAAIGSPALHEIPSFEFAEGRAFAVLQMNQIVSDPDHDLADLQWSVVESNLAYVSVVGTQIYLGIIDVSWTGTTEITLVVCDPEGACDEQALSITVTPQNHAPMLSVPDQLEDAGTPFAALPLAQYAEDTDDAFDTLGWEILGNTALDVEVVGGSLLVTPPSDDWVGIEYVDLTVCDPQAACDTQRIAIGRLTGGELRVQYITSAGYILDSGGLKIAIDALFSMGATSAMTRQMRSAEAPFDVDVILVTANDSYHASPSILAANLAANPDATLIAPSNLVQAILALEPSLNPSGFSALDLGVAEVASVEAAGQTFDVAGYRHYDEGADPCLAYSFALGGTSILYLGEVNEDSLASAGEHAFSDASYDFGFIPSYAYSLANLMRNPVLQQCEWTISSCQRSDTYGCSCAYSSSGDDRILCLNEELEEMLLPTN